MTGLRHWLRQERLWDGFDRLGRLFSRWRNKPSGRYRPRRYAPELERLETRELLAVLSPITEYTIPTGNSGPFGIAQGPDGNIWFVENAGNKVAKVTPTGSFTEYTITSSPGVPYDIAAGGDGNLWFTITQANKVAKVTTSGTITEYTVPTALGMPRGITAGDGVMWFVEWNGSKIGKVTTSGSFTEYSIPALGGNAARPEDLVVGPDDNLWFTTSYAGGTTHSIGKMDLSGNFTMYSVPTASAQPWGIAVGPDGNIWFTELSTHKIGRVTLGGVFTEFSIPTGSSAPKGIAAGPNNSLWFVESAFGANNVGLIDVASGQITEILIPTANASPWGMSAGPNNTLWFSENGTNKIAKINWAPSVTPTALTPIQPEGVVVPFGPLLLAPLNGNVHVAHPLEFGDSHPDCGCHAPIVNPPIPGTLNYNSQTTNAKPILQIAYASDANGSVPSQIDVRLDWNSGGFGSWTTFQTTGHSAGDV
jgi:virginiamycin B lyase